MKKQSKFSHVPNFTDYIDVAVQTVSNFFSDGPNKKILDVHSGNGLVSSTLKKQGALMASADINKEQSNYFLSDMEKQLPLKDENFDSVICFEGIEHILHTESLFSELTRAVKKGGLSIISTPNVQNFYTRYQLLCTGFLFKFDPFDKTPLKEGKIRDKVRISRVFYTQLRYYSDLHNLKTLKRSGGGLKTIVVLPFFLPFILTGYYWSISDWEKTNSDRKKLEIINHQFTTKLLFSRFIDFKVIKN